MKTLRYTVFILAFAVAAAAAAAQSRGEGRITGKVVDPKGQPVPDVQVKGVMAGQNQVLQAKSNKRGEWSLNGLAIGQWNLEFAKEGFETQKVTVDLPDTERVPNVNVTLAPPAPKVDPNAEIQAEAQKAATLMQQEKFAEARRIYEDLLIKHPSLYQLHSFIARTYAGEKNYDKAVEHLRISVEKEPTNVDMKMLLGDILMEKGDKEEGLQLLLSLDVTQVKNAYPLINAAITLINDQKADQAVDLMNKIIQQFPNQADTYYYRGRAYVAAKKLPEAKADLEKFVAMAPPDARELPDARKILEQLKTVK